MYVVNLLLQLGAGSIASAYNWNIDKQLSATHENFYYEIFINQKILVLSFKKFLHMKIWHYTVAIMSH